MKLSALIKRENITIDVRPGTLTPTEQKDDWKRTAFKYRVTLRRGDAKMHVPFFMGSALTVEQPTAEDVLDALASDASGYDNADGFEDWASEYGYDTDSRKAENIYRQVGAQASDLRNLMGDAYDDLLAADRL